MPSACNQPDYRAQPTAVHGHNSSEPQVSRALLVVDTDSDIQACISLAKGRYAGTRKVSSHRRACGHNTGRSAQTPSQDGPSNRQQLTIPSVNKSCESVIQHNDHAVNSDFKATLQACGLMYDYVIRLRRCILRQISDHDTSACPLNYKSFVRM